jgi:hypothetical protein
LILIHRGASFVRAAGRNTRIDHDDEADYYDNIFSNWWRSRFHRPSAGATSTVTDTSAAAAQAPEPAAPEPYAQDREVYQACLKDNLSAISQCDYLFTALEKCKLSAAAVPVVRRISSPAVRADRDPCEDGYKAHQACLKTHPTAAFQCDFLFSALEACKAAAVPVVPSSPALRTVPTIRNTVHTTAPTTATGDACQVDQKAYSACLREHPTATFHCDFLFGALDACKARM